MIENDLAQLNIFEFFSRTTEPISIKLGPNHPWVKGIQICSYGDHWSFLRGDNSKQEAHGPHRSSESLQ